MYCLVKPFDKKTHICDICHKHLSRNEMPCQTVFNKMSSDPIPDELKDLKKKKKKKLFFFKWVGYKKIAVMYGKGKFAKIKGSICNIPIETANMCNILPRPADSNGLIVVKLKQDLRYRGYVYLSQYA